MEVQQTRTPPMGEPAPVDVEFVPLNDPKDIEAADNDGEQFFEVTAAVGKELGTLSPFDIAGGMRTLGQGVKDSATNNLTEGRDAFKALNVRDGWAGFSESASARQLVKAPLGVVQGLMALIFFTLFCMIFYPAKYGPPLAAKVNEKAIQPGWTAAKEKVVAPLVAKAGPLIEQGKSKLNEVLASRGVGVQQQVTVDSDGDDNL